MGGTSTSDLNQKDDLPLQLQQILPWCIDVCMYMCIEVYMQVFMCIHVWLCKCIDIQVYNYIRASIPSNVSLTDTPIVTVKAEDNDYGLNAAIEYSIVSGADNTFDIDINTGIITRRNGAALNFDIQSTYTIVVGIYIFYLLLSKILKGITCQTRFESCLLLFVSGGNTCTGHNVKFTVK